MAGIEVADKIGKVYADGVQIKEVYAGPDLIYKAQSDTYSVTASSYTDGATVASGRITNTENYEKMVIESVEFAGGNFGHNIVRLYCNGVCVLQASGDIYGFRSAVNSWSGTFPISQNGTVYVEVYSDRDSNRDDYYDAISVTVKFHFE